MVEGARLESECAPKGYRGFESLPLRKSFIDRERWFRGGQTSTRTGLSDEEARSEAIVLLGLS